MSGVAGKSGAPNKLTAILHQKIIDNVPLVLVPSQVAALSHISKHVLNEWLRKGEEDLKNGIESDYAILTTDFREAQALTLREKMQILSTCPKNYGAITWQLEKCFKEDFGIESALYSEVMGIIAEIKAREMVRENSPRKGNSNGQMDSESN